MKMKVSAEQIKKVINRHYRGGRLIGLTEVQFAGMGWIRLEGRIGQQIAPEQLAEMLNMPLNADIVRICLLIQAMDGTHHVDFAVSEFQAPRRRFHFEKASNSVF